MNKGDFNIINGDRKYLLQPMKPLVAAIRLNIEMNDWNGTKLEVMITEKERAAMKAIYLVIEQKYAIYPREETWPTGY